MRKIEKLEEAGKSATKLGCSLMTMGISLTIIVMIGFCLYISLASIG